MWQGLVRGLLSVVPEIIKKYLVSAVLGLSGPVGWLVNLFLVKLWNKEEKNIELQAEYVDKKKIGDENVKELKQAEDKGDLDAIAKSAENLLNGSSGSNSH